MQRLSAAAGLAFVWIAIVLTSAYQGWGRAPLAPPGDPLAFAAALESRIRKDSVGNAVCLLLEDGRIVHEVGVSAGRPVDRDSVFQVASLSKWISAWGVMALVEAGRIELDAPVVDYLTRWRFPESGFDTAGVTVRRLLSHTAGLTDGLGYDGFAPGERIQTLEESLTQAADPMPRASGMVRIGREPGRRWQYSGGGYTLLQLLIEDVTGEDFASYMRRVVLDPLGMRHSTFDAREAEALPLVDVHDARGQKATHRRFTALAAASLYSSASDLARFLQAHLPGPNGEPIGRGVLEPRTLREMRSPHAFRLGRPIWGLGTILYARARADDEPDSFVIGHEGQNPPAINTSARLDPATGNGIVILATGNPSLATTLTSEWVYWETGRVDIMMLARGFERTAWTAGIGVVVIAVLAVALARWRAGRRDR